MSDTMDLAPQGKNFSVEVASSKTMQEVKAAVFMAKQFPRDQVAAIKRITAACQRPGLAEQGVYQYPKGDKKVTGASIRLAEAMAREWGNLQYGIIEQEREGDTSTMMAYAWDLETNTRAMVEYKVRLFRDSKAGGKVALDTERDIYEAVANQGSRRLRACILKMIPSDVVENAEKECENTLRARIQDMPAELKSMVESFKEFGVTKAMIEARLRHPLDSSSAGEALAMRRIYTSIADGMGEVKDYFELETTAADNKIAPANGTAAKALAAAQGATRKAPGATQTGKTGSGVAGTAPKAPAGRQNAPAGNSDPSGIPENI